MKVLDGQCKRYFRDDEAREAVKKAFEKLFKNGYAVYYDELSPKERRIIDDKKVQHYIPWRCVWKASISTPCRPVLNASTKTKVRKD